MELKEIVKNYSDDEYFKIEFSVPYLWIEECIRITYLKSPTGNFSKKTGEPLYEKDEFHIHVNNWEHEYFIKKLEDFIESLEEYKAKHCKP